MRDLAKFKKPKAARILGGALGLLLVLSLVLMPTPALAVPQMPHQFYGTVTIGEDLAPEGTIVSAQIGGVKYLSTTVDAKGRYGYHPDYGGTGIFKVPADDPGTPEKEGVVAGETVDFYVSYILADQYKFEIWGITELNLTVAAVAPEVATSAASSITRTSATLNGNLTDLGTALSVDVSFEWGTTIAYGNGTAARTMTATGSFTASLSGLSANTTYHFRARADGGVHGTSYGTDRTFTTTRALVPSPPAGGGGAPAYYIDIDLFGIEESYRISEYGKLRETIEATSADVMVIITVPKGTRALDEDGKRLKLLVIAVDETPPPPPEDAHVIGLAYNFEPEGASFDPPIELLINYDPEELPENVSSVFIAYYDKEQGWTKLGPISGFVAAVGTATAQVSHFTTFAVIATVKPPAPAAFTVSKLIISPTEVDIGQSVTITAVVTNTGGETGGCKAVLRIDGVLEVTKEVTISAGASEEVTFTTAKDVAGSYSVAVDGLTGSFTVKEKAPPAAPPEEAPPAVKPFPWPLIGGIVAGVVIVGLLIFFLVRRRAY